MAQYQVQKAFENFSQGDIVTFNPRQAQYRLLSGHIKPAEYMQESIPDIDEDQADAPHEIEFVADTQATGRKPKK